MPGVKCVITFDRVLVFAVTRNQAGGEISETDCVSSRPTGDGTSDREEVAECSKTINFKIFDTEGVGYSQLVGREPGDAEVADGVWSLDVLRDGVCADVQRVG